MLLITRVVSVLYQATFISAFFVVMLFADTVVLVLLFTTPLPIISIMGGIRLTESERLIQGTAVMVGFWAAVTWLVWLIGTCAVAAGRSRWGFALGVVPTAGRISPSLWGLAAASLLVWLPVLPAIQSEQHLRWRVERDLR